MLAEAGTDGHVVVHYDSYTEARAHLKDLLDAAERGRVATSAGTPDGPRWWTWSGCAGLSQPRFRPEHRS
jgi:hypothetical protein